MKYAYIESGTGTVWAASTNEFTVEQVAEDIPQVDSRREDAPDTVQAKASGLNRYHRWTGTDYELVWELQPLKDEKNYAIDMKTRQIIAVGVLYDGHRFPLDVNDQSTWHARRNNFVDSVLFSIPITFPMKVMTSHNEEYWLQNGNELLAMYYGGFAQVGAILEGGRAVKALVNACTTKEEIDAVTDDRVIPVDE